MPILHLTNYLLNCVLHQFIWFYWKLGSNTSALKLKCLNSVHITMTGGKQKHAQFSLLKNDKSPMITLSENQTHYVIQLKVILSDASVPFGSLYDWICCCMLKLFDKYISLLVPPANYSLNIFLISSVNPLHSLLYQNTSDAGIITLARPACHSVPESLFASALSSSQYLFKARGRESSHSSVSWLPAPI